MDKESFSGSFGTRSRGNHDPGDRKKVNDRRSNCDPAFGLRQKRKCYYYDDDDVVVSLPRRVLISPLLSVLTLLDSDERAATETKET